MIKSIKKVTGIFAALAVVIFFGGCSFSKAANEKNTSNISKSSVTDKSKVQINSGLLLGLVKEPDLTNKSKNNTDFENKQVEEYRTLWIYGDGKGVSCLEKKDSIVAPYGDKFVKLTSNSIVDSDTSSISNSSNNFYSKYDSYHNFSVVLSQDINDTKVELSKDSLKKNYLNAKEGEMGSAFISRTETILYAGNKYAAIRVSQFDTGGGTYRSGYDDIKLYDINSLSKLGDKKTGISLKSLLGSDADKNIKELTAKYNKNISDEGFATSKNIINDTDLCLNRSEGRWIVQAPLYEAYQNQGNGSNYNTIQVLYNTDIAVPKALTSYDALCVDWNTIQSKIPTATDAVTSPNKDMLVVLTTNSLQVFANPEKGLNKPILKIPVSNMEKIVLNQWATGDYVNKWTKLIK